jgi:predicted RNase H-like HicB family nuclease
VERVEGYTVVYRQAEDVILAEVPAIPGCFSDGSTLEEARERVRDAILNFLDEMKEAGQDIPSDVLHVERIVVGTADSAYR